MYNHAPYNYACPFCLLRQGIKNDQVLSVASDVFFEDRKVTALISSHQWPNNPGHALVIPNQYYENIYDLPAKLGFQIHLVAQQIALAMKALYRCDGVSTRQHNEPDGDRDVWYYHLHVFPRYAGDNLYRTQRAVMPEDERSGYARKLNKYFMEITDE
jgi:histidine triad (HIT) family protein